MNIEKRSRYYHWRTKLTPIETVVAVIIFMVLLVFLLPAVSRNRPHLPKLQCRNNLKYIGQALQTYAAIYGALPPSYTVDETGRRLHSWRTLILPYLGQDKLYSEIDLSKPWDDPVNTRFHQSPVSAYHCMASRSAMGHTNYLAVVTPKSCIRETASIKLTDVTNDPANTWLVVEVPSANSVPWMAPQDADESLVLSITNETVTNHTEGLSVLMANGSPHTLSKQLPVATRQAMINATNTDTTRETKTE